MEKDPQSPTESTMIYVKIVELIELLSSYILIIPAYTCE